LARAVQALKRGQLVVTPTDTVYGVAAKPDLAPAVAALFAAKGRDRRQPVPVLVANLAQAEKLAELSDQARGLIAAHWPGALTLVLPAKDAVTWDLGQRGGTIALRQPRDETCLELLDLAGPLAVSSANRSGDVPALDASESLAKLGQQVAVYVDAGPARGGQASSVLDLTGLAPGLLRPGPIGADQLLPRAKRGSGTR